jgi:hypothetical protein
MRKKISHAEWLAEAARRFGPDARTWQFVCPACGTVQSAADLLATGKFKPGSGEVNSVLGFSCIGRFTGKGDEGIGAKNHGETWTNGCNWTLGGLLQIHTSEVVFEDGGARPVFEFAESQPALAVAGGAS